MSTDRKPVTLNQLLAPEFPASRLIAAGMSSAEATAKGKRFASAAKALIDAGNHSDTSAFAVFVPGRIEVLGKHTDYCGGRSLLCTVERGMCFVAAANADRRVSFFALDVDQSAQWSLDPQLQPTPRHWSNYPMTVTRRLARNFSSASTGADIAMSSDLPPASGLSSSSAMIIGTFIVMAAINDLQNTSAYRDNIRAPKDFAAYLGCVENGQTFAGLEGDRGVGTFGGSEDHTAILCSKANTLSVYSFCPVRHERDIKLPDQLRFFIANSGVIAEKTGDALAKYNRVSNRARTIVSLWNQTNGHRAACLNDIITSGPSALPDLRALLSDAPIANGFDNLASRLDQFVIESDHIIPGAVNAIDRDDWQAFRQLVDESQQHAETDLENQVPQTIELRKKLLKSGALAASAFGAGFGGSVWALYAADQNDADERLNGVAEGFTTRPGCPAVEIHI